MRKLRVYIFFILFLSLSHSAYAVILTAKDGKKFEWDGYYDNGNEYCTRRGGGSFCVPKSEIVSIKKDGGAGLIICDFKGVKQSAAPVTKPATPVVKKSSSYKSSAKKSTRPT